MGNKVKLKLIIGMILLGGMFSAYPADTVYETLFTNQAVSINKGISAKSSIGQTSHQAVLIFKDQGGVCSPSSVIYFEGTNNNVDWIPFGTNSDLKQANQQLTYVINGQGFFPYIRVKVNGVGANCVVDGYYTGSVNGTAPINPSVVYETLFLNQSDEIYKPIKSAIGQIGHQVILTYKDSGGACSPFNTIYLEGSSDGIVWSAFGSNANKVLTQNKKNILTGQGFYPYIRLYASAAQAKCVADAYYTGTVYQSPINNIQGSLPAPEYGVPGIPTTIDNRAVNPILIAGYGYGHAISPIIACDLTFLTTVGGNASVLAVLGGTNSRIYVCSYSFVGNAGAGTSMQLTESSNADCSASTVLTPPYTLVSSNIVVGTGLGTVVNTSAINKHLCIQAGPNGGIGSIRYTQF